MLPRLARQLVELGRPGGKCLGVEADAAAQHAAEVFAGVEHLLEQRLALAERRIRIDPIAGGQGQAAQGQQKQGTGNHGYSRLRIGKRATVSAHRRHRPSLRGVTGRVGTPQAAPIPGRSQPAGDPLSAAEHRQHAGSYRSVYYSAWAQPPTPL
ncbi:hypothetical protein D3C81_1321150 [compost metagenome]